jgi:hypothetical protein
MSGSRRKMPLFEDLKLRREEEKGGRELVSLVYVKISSYSGQMSVFHQGEDDHYSLQVGSQSS